MARNGTKNPPSPAFLILQEVAWALGFVAMVINATDGGLDWTWVGVLTCWQATIIWGFIQLRRTKTTETQSIGSTP